MPYNQRTQTVNATIHANRKYSIKCSHVKLIDIASIDHCMKWSHLKGNHKVTLWLLP